MEVVIKSSVGKLDLLYYHSKNTIAPVVIVANADVEDEKKYQPATDVICEAFIKNDFSVLKFNFRKNKNISKELTTDDINLLDLIAALDWLHSKNIESKSFWFAGIDTGAFYGLQLVMRRPEIDNYILFSPNMKKNNFDFLVPCISCGALVRASEDLRFLEEDCINLQEKLMTKTESKIKYFTIYNTERNFDTELEQLKNETFNYIKERIIESNNSAHEISKTKRRRRKKKIQNSKEDKIIYINPIKDCGFDQI